MRWLLVLLLSLFAGTLVSAAPARDWRTVVRAAPAGGYVIGNPAAKVKLIEYVSYTCPHCRHFVEQSHDVLIDRMVRSGSTSVEVRNQLHDKVDLIAAVLARCIGPARFPRYLAAVYAAQDDWWRRAVEYDQSNAVAALPAGRSRARAFADASGLSDIAKGAGMTPTQLNACLATNATLDAVAKSATEIRPDVPSTPAFEINGRLITNVTWPELEPQLRAAGAR